MWHRHWQGSSSMYSVNTPRSAQTLAYLGANLSFTLFRMRSTRDGLFGLYKLTHPGALVEHDDSSSPRRLNWQASGLAEGNIATECPAIGRWSQAAEKHAELGRNC